MAPLLFEGAYLRALTFGQRTIAIGDAQGGVKTEHSAAEGEDVPKTWPLDDRRGTLEAVGFSLFDWTITGKTPRQMRRDFGSSDIIHVNGGSTIYLLLQAQGRGCIKIITKFVTDGDIYLCSSAGSIIAGPDISVSRQLEGKPFRKK